MRSSTSINHILLVAFITWLLYLCHSSLNAKNGENPIQNSDGNPLNNIDLIPPPAIEIEELLADDEHIASIKPIINELKDPNIKVDETTNNRITYKPPLLNYEDPIVFNPDEPTRIVVISMTMDAKYGFYAPITAFLWTLMGWKPVVIAMGTASYWDESVLGRVLRDAVLKCGGIIEYLPHHPDLFLNFNAGYIAQISRLMVGFMNSIPEDAYVLLAYVYYSCLS